MNESGPAVRAGRALLAAAALGLSIYLVISTGVPEAWSRATADLSSSGQLLLMGALVLPVLIGYCFHTAAWSFAFGREGAGMGWGRLFSIRLAGEAVNQVTPLLPLGGEPIKALLYAAGGGCLARGAVSVLATRLVMTFGQVILVFAAVAVAFTQRSDQAASLAALAAFPLFVGVNLILTPALLLFAGSRLRERLGRIWIIRRNRAGLQAIARAANFWREEPRACLLVLVYSLAGWIAAAAEFWMVARAVDAPISWETAVMLEGLLTSITMATFFIPGNLGSQEAGILYLCQLYAPGPLAPVMTVIRRLREVIWIVAGLAVLALIGMRPAWIRQPGKAEQQTAEAA